LNLAEVVRERLASTHKVIEWIASSPSSPKFQMSMDRCSMALLAVLIVPHQKNLSLVNFRQAGSALAEQLVLSEGRFCSGQVLLYSVEQAQTLWDHQIDLHLAV